jgi:putative ABC transport system permease protein
LRATVHPFDAIMTGDSRPALAAFSGAAAVLLLIACVNVAGLLVVRGVPRTREMAIRSALGASGGRVVRQLMEENLVLACAGGVIGVPVAWAALRAFITLAPSDIPRVDEIGMNGTALIAAVVVSGITVVLFGLAPAVAASRVDVQQVLRSDSRQTPTRWSRRAAEMLVAGQVALAFVVLAWTGLIVRSLMELERAELAFDPDGLVIGSLALRTDAFVGKEARLELLDRLMNRLEATPGVRSVSPVVATPFSGSGGWDGRPSLEGQTPDEAAQNPMLNMEVVATNYFTTMGVRIVHGRPFEERDREDAPHVVILSASAASHYWPGADPLGRRLQFGPSRTDLVTVVGIVPDTRYRDLREARPSIYFPLRQSIFPFTPTSLVIRTTQRGEDILPAIRSAAAGVDADIAFRRLASLDSFLERPLARPRLNAFLLSVFAGAAALLAAVGLAAVVSAAVRQRTHELGIRVALGATVERLRRGVIVRGVTVAAAGTAVGLAATLAANRVIEPLLFGLRSSDAPTRVGAAVLLLGVAAATSALAARSSLRIDPASALHDTA